MEKEKFIKLIELSEKILNKSTEYSLNKEIIKYHFNNNISEDEFKNVYNRLTLIDSYYSTNMNRTYGGIRGIAEKMTSYKDLKKVFNDYLNNPIYNKEHLFHKKYGYVKKVEKDKDGEYADTGKQAQSLITKYAYYCTDYKYPIFDSLARESLHIILNKDINLIKDMKSIKKIKPTVDNLKILQNFIVWIKAFKNYLNENDSDNDNEISFDHIDRFLWLYGKIRRGSFALIMDKKHYQELYSEVRKEFGEDKIYQNDCKKNKCELNNLKSDLIGKVISYYILCRNINIFKINSDNSPNELHKFIQMIKQFHSKEEKAERGKIINLLNPKKKKMKAEEARKKKEKDLRGN